MKKGFNIKKPESNSIKRNEMKIPPRLIMQIRECIRSEICNHKKQILKALERKKILLHFKNKQITHEWKPTP